MATINEAAVLSIRRRAAEGTSYAALAREYRVSHAAISQIARGVRWAHVGGPLQPAKRRRKHGPTWAPLEPAQVVQIRERFAAGESLAALTAAYRLGQDTASDIVYGRSWPNLGGPIAAPGSTRGERNGRAKLTAGAVLSIRGRADVGASNSTLAGEYQVSERTIRDIVSRRTWAHI